MDIFRSEVKAGIMVLIALVVLVFGIFMIGGLKDLGKKRNHFTLLFQSTSGIKKNSQVWFEGYEIGSVTNIRLFKSTPAEKIHKDSVVWSKGEKMGKVVEAINSGPYQDYIALSVKVDPRASIKTDSRAIILPLGLMGEKVVKLSRGSEKAQPLRSGDALMGQPSMTMEALFEEGKEITGSIKEITEETKATILEVKKLVQNFEETYRINDVVDRVRALLDNLKQRSEDLGFILKNINGLVTDMRPRVIHTIDNLENTTEGINKVVDEVRPKIDALLKEVKGLTRDVRKDLDTLVPNLDRLLIDADKTIINVDQLVTQTKGTLTKVDPLLVDARGTIKTVDRVLADAQGAVKNLEILLKDADSIVDENRENIYFILSDLRQTARHMKVLMEDLREAPWKVIWKTEGKAAQVEWTRLDQEEWRIRGRIGRHEKE